MDLLVNGRDHQQHRSFRPRQRESSDRLGLDPKLLGTDQDLRRPFGELDRLLCEWLSSLSVFDLQGLGRLFVGVGLQHVLDLREDGVELLSELLVRGVVGFGCDVTAQVFQLIEGEQHRNAGGRGSDGIGKLVVDVDGVFEDELPLSQGQPEPELLVLIDALLPHDITPKHSIRFSLVEPAGSNNRLSLPTNTQPSSIWSRPGGWVGSPTEGLRLTCPRKALGGSRLNSRLGTVQR